VASASDVKFYKSNNNGLGGGIDTSQLISSSNPNNLFPFVTKTQQDSGVTRYLLAYIKNTSAETIKNVQFWRSAGTPGDFSGMNWAKGISGKNGNEASIANITTAPTGVTDWVTDRTVVTLGDFAPNDRYGLWFRSSTLAGAPIIRDDQSIFKFKFTTESGGTGSTPDPSGGGTGSSGGNPPPTNIDWKIAVVGDCDGTTSATEKVFKLMDSKDRIIMVGDYAYGDPDAFISKANSHNMKSKIIGFAMGNHEEDDGYGKFCNWYGISQSKTWFMRKFENIAVITIDSNKSLGGGSTQNTDVKNMLKDAEADPNIDWIVSTNHFPWFGSGSDHGYNEKQQVNAFHALFASSQKFAFVFTGHNHNWQRTHKVIYNSSDPEDPTVTDSSSPFVNDTNGLIHVVTGTGGHDAEGHLYSLNDSIGSPGNPNAYQNRSHNGIYELIASNNGKTLTCRFLDIDNGLHDTITYTTT